MIKHRGLNGYALAGVALAVATLIRWAFDPVLSQHLPFPTYFAAVAIVAVYGGFGPAVVTLVGGSVLSGIFFLPTHGLLLGGAEYWMGLLLFVGASGLMIASTTWLRRNTSRLEAVVSTAHEGIVTQNLQGVITGWNPGAQRMYGYTAEEMVGRSAARLAAPDQQSELAWIVAQVRDHGPIEALETARVRKDGQRIDVLLSAAPIRSNRGRVEGIATIERDVTERWQIERAHRATEARLQAIIDNSPVILFIKDLQGRYFMVNAAYERLFATSAERVLGTTDRDRFSPEDAQMFQRNDETVIDTGLAHRFEEHFRVSGSSRVYLTTKFPLHDENGDVYAVCGMATDITEQKHRHQALLDLDRRKDQFLSMLAHELRNPLAPIANAARLLHLNGNDLDPRTAWAAEVIERQCTHLTQMVDDLLDIARFSTGRIQLRRQAADVTALVEQSVDNLRPRFEARGVAFTARVAAEPIFVDVDAARLVQIVDNLLDNAVKYTDANGRVDLELSQVGDDCVLRVRDTGIGINPEDLPHVFDLFEQVDDSLDRARGGLGLGLNLVKRMVELHGGRVEAASEGRGTGSEFTVRLPLAAEAAAPADSLPGSGTAGPLAARRVLVIEDNMDTAQSMEMLLAALGHDVRVELTGGAGLAAADAFGPQLALVDLGLPDIDGYEVARTLRSRFGDSLRLIALTGYGQEKYRRRAREAGFDEHLLKPLSMEALEGALASCG